MQITIISDTHGMHDRLALEAGDVLIHCGDWSGWSTEQDTIDFAAWLARQPYEHKLCVAGNHDKFADPKYFESENCHYLQDSSLVIEGFKFYGMPWTPMFYDWHWMRERGEEMKEVTDLIPNDTDVLITHGPAFGVMDRVLEGNPVGCEDLALKIGQIKDLKLHCFGHIHETYGKKIVVDGDGEYILLSDYSGSLRVNASQANRSYRLVNKPITVEL